MAEAENFFNTFIGGVYLCFGGTTGSDLLSSTTPIDRAVKEEDIFRDGSCLESFKFGDGCERVALVLDSPVRICEW